MRITFYNFLVIIIVFHCIIPISMLWWIYKGKSSSKFTWSLKNLLVFLYLFLLFLAGFWEELSYYCRGILVIIYAVSAIKSLVKARPLPLYTRIVYVDWLFAYAGFAASCLLIFQIVSAFSAYTYKDSPARLSFPFKNGTYMIAFGGNGKESPLINYHYQFPLYSRSKLDVSVIYAVDIVKLNPWGKSGKGFMSKDNQKYEIYGETVISPCDGEIIDIEDRYPDELPYGYNYPNSPGNSIVIRHDDIYILLGHLEKDSILVKPGDHVVQGQTLGKVGNSGWSTEPHLHIQAIKTYGKDGREGEGVPILFDDRFPVKNNLFFR